MKKLFFTLLVIASVSFASAQTSEEKKAASDFIKSRTEAFNKNTTPVFVKDLDSIERVVNRANLSYRKVSHVFFGEISDSNSAGGGLNSYTDDNSKPFIYYTIQKYGNQTVILAITGHNGW